MDANQTVYYALGQLAYAVAKADGFVQQEEKEKLHDLVVEATQNQQYEFDCSEIIFQILNKDGQSSQDAYEWALNELRTVTHLLSDERKEQIMDVLDKVAEAFPPTTSEESGFLKRAKSDLDRL